MSDKLHYFINKEGKKVYTLKSEIDGKPTQEVPYKFIKLRDAPKN